MTITRSKPTPGGGDALTTNPLSQFAATSSAQLRGVLNDEAGTGVALFAGHPSFDLVTIHGADVTISAGVLNLDTATGLTVTCTNSSALNTITLSDGRIRFVRFTGTPIISSGANLVLPGGANITAVAGDIFGFVGYPAGVVYGFLYSPATVTGTGGLVKPNTPTLTTPKLAGATSGTCTLAPQAVAGSNTVTMPLAGQLYQGHRTVFCTATVAWASMPAAVTEFKGATSQRKILDLSLFTQVRFSTLDMAVAGFAGATLRLQYSTDSGGTWNYFDSTGANSGPSVAIDGTAGTPVQSAYVTMDSAARIDGLWVRMVGINGNGAVSPQFGMIDVEFK